MIVSLFVHIILMSFFESICYYAGLLCLFQSIFILYRWIISYFSSPVDLKKKYNSEWALVTGANAGLGLKIATRLAEQGYNIIGTGRNIKALDEAKNGIENKYPNVKFVPLPADFSNYEAGVKVISEKLQNSDLDIKIAVINAGYGIFGPITKLENSQIHDFVTTMCTSYAQLAREFIIKNKAAIYNNKENAKDNKSLLYITASLAAETNAPLATMYCSAKTYDSAFIKHLSIEKHGTNLDITAMQPGFFSNSKFFANLPGFLGKLFTAENIYPSSDEVCECVMKTLGKGPIVDCSANSLLTRMLFWILGEYPTYLLSKLVVNLANKKIEKK